MRCLPNIPPFAQFIAVCRRSKVVSMGTRRHRRGACLCRRCALPRRGDTPRLRQILRATKSDKLSVTCVALPTAFHAAEGDPSNLKLCQRGEWQDRMLVETVLAMLTLVCHCKRVMHRVGRISRHDSPSPWRPFMCWSSGMAYGPMRLASCPSPWLSLVCKILIPSVT
jgi:hypothetical protein